MATYTAHVRWALAEGEDFRKGRYSRRHLVRFDCGIEMAGSASPHVVPRPWSVEDAVDPEEALVAALSACHMLTFLHVAREAGFVVAAYEDAAEGVLGKNAQGRWAVTRVVLRPAITYEGPCPDLAASERLHRAAHEGCFIANSVRTEVAVEPAA